MNKRWILFSLFNFLVAALMGLILRGAFLWEIGWLDYRNMMHGHSHVAMLGWVYLALYALIGYRFIPREQWEKPIYPRLFWFTQFTVFGMMVSFPLQGYGAVSITFSTLHIFASYAFGYLVWRDHQTRHPEVSLLIKTALVFMVLSTIGVWSLGPLTLTGGRSSTLYQLAIQFYLHFQFHGWFTFSTLALVLDVLTKNQFIHTTRFKGFYLSLAASAVLTYGLVLAWGYGGPIPLIFNGLGLLLQVAALLLFFRMTGVKNRDFLQAVPSSTRMLYRFGLASWIAKIGIQTIVILPAAAVVSFVLRPFIIGFIHLTMLGFISGLLFAMIFSLNCKMADSRGIYYGRAAFMMGFALTELLLFTQGLFYWFQWGQLPAYYELVFATSVLLPLAIALMTLSVIRHYNVKTLNPAMIIK